MPYIVERDKIVPINVNNTYDSKPLHYKMNDLSSVFTHWDVTLGHNVETHNILLKNK